MIKVQLLIPGFMLFALASANAQAQDSASISIKKTNNVTGYWKSYDDKTGKAKALILIDEKDGVVSGHIEKLFRESDQDQNPLCSMCEGVNKGKPVIGLTILTGMHLTEAPSNTTMYADGKIVDPANGEVYKSNMTLSEDGNTLQVRGYIGAPLFGRTQTWLRAK